MDTKKTNTGKRIIPMIAILCCLLLLGSVGYLTYSWYFVGDATGKLGFEVLQIDSVVTLYEGIDDNYNGVPDLLSTNGREDNSYRYYKEGTDEASYVSYDLIYYTEKHDFSYVDTTLVLEKDSTANLFIPVVLKEVFPSRVYTLKYALGNYSFADNAISCSFDDVTSTENTLSPKGQLEHFRMRVGVVDENGDLTFGEWTKFSFDGSGKVLPLALDFSEEVTIDPYTGDGQTGRLDLWLQIQLLPETGNELQNTDVTFPDFRITFEAQQ